jgi:hypothetical protein
MLSESIVSTIKSLVNKHHMLYRFPVKGELWEDIFDQAINGNDSNWNMGSHNVGSDVICSLNGCRYQNKAGSINLKNQTLTWSGHRTTKYKTIEEKIKFISDTHCDKYVMLATNKKEWKLGHKNYYLFEFDSDIIDYSILDWNEKISKKGNTSTGWEGKSSKVAYTAKILKSMSDQLWITCKFQHIGTPTIISLK